MGALDSAEIRRAAVERFNAERMTDRYEALMYQVTGRELPEPDLPIETRVTPATQRAYGRSPRWFRVENGELGPSSRAAG